LVQEILPEESGMVDVPIVMYADISLAVVQRVMTSTRLSATVLLEALSLLFGASEEVRVWGPFA
jgi:hypothetical protein